MYFKTEKGSETFDKLDNVWRKINDFDKQANDLVIELGYTKYGRSNIGIGGGISCIYSKTKPEGFKTVGKIYQNLIYPKASNKKLLKRFKELPIVSLDEYNDAIGFKPQFKGLTHYKNYGSKRVGELFIVEVPDNCNFQPPLGMVEILNSEYKALKEKVL